jgi:hypothetical protein
MKKFHAAYLLDANGHIGQRVNLICASEEDAKRHAEQLAEDGPVELWQGATLIAIYPARTE